MRQFVRLIYPPHSVILIEKNRAYRAYTAKSFLRSRSLRGGVPLAQNMGVHCTHGFPSRGVAQSGLAH